MDELEKMHIRKVATALDRVLKEDGRLSDEVRSQIRKRKAKRQKRLEIELARKMLNSKEGRP